MDDFHTVFELTTFSLLRSLFDGFQVFLFALIAVSVLGYNKRNSKLSSKLPSALFFVLFAIASLCITMGNTIRSVRLYNAYRSKECPQVEGVVHITHQQPYHGHSEGDAVEIGGEKFNVSYFEGGPHYKQTIAHGGDLREGVKARVWYCNIHPISEANRAIVRVDISLQNETTK